MSAGKLRARSLTTASSRLVSSFNCLLSIATGVGAGVSLSLLAKILTLRLRILSWLGHRGRKECLRLWFRYLDSDFVKRDDSLWSPSPGLALFNQCELVPLIPH